MARPYDGPIIDAHHHLWDLSLGRHPWLAPEAGARGSLGDLAPLRRSYLPADYRRDARNQPVVATVHVEAGWRRDDALAETRWLDSLDKAGGVAARYVVQVPLDAPDAAAQIETQAANPRVVGVRDALAWDADPARRFAARADLMDDRAWRAGLARLSRHGLVFDLLLFPSQLADAARLADAVPDQLFVLEHCGSPADRDADGLARWRAGLRALAQRPNVAIKISDPVAYDHGWTLDSLAKVVRPCLDCFGPARAMIGSDFPVAGLHAGFDRLFDAFRALTADLSADEQALLFAGTAARIYRLADALSPPRGLAPGQQQQAQDQ